MRNMVSIAVACFGKLQLCIRRLLRWVSAASKMGKAQQSVIEVQGAAITILSQKEQDFICLTDIARFKSADRFDDLIRNWLRNRNTVEFLGVWERLNNPRK